LSIPISQHYRGDTSADSAYCTNLD
jgi:hypothetical protein